MAAHHDYFSIRVTPQDKVFCGSNPMDAEVGRFDVEDWREGRTGRLFEAAETIDSVLGCSSIPDATVPCVNVVIETRIMQSKLVAGSLPVAPPYARNFALRTPTATWTNPPSFSPYNSTYVAKPCPRSGHFEEMDRISRAEIVRTWPLNRVRIVKLTQG